jgi:hypothetical protein
MLPQELRGRFLVKYWSHDKTREVDWVLGAFMLTRRKIVCEVGGFDTDYFLYGEDTDLCYRIKQAGGKIIFSPEAEVIHIGNPIWDLERKKRVYNAYLTFYRKQFSMSSLLLLKILITLKLFMVRRSFDKLRTSSRRSSGF